jgi:serine/threonine-protein kinase
LDLVSTPLEFRTTASVQIAAGKIATAVVAVPNGSLSVNALPWAEVEIDGRPAGTTPLANLSLPIGSHEIVWKNPQLGERRRTVAVTAGAPARVGVDFSQ